MKKYILFLFTLLPFLLNAQAVSIEKAEKLAQNYIKTKQHFPNNKLALLEKASAIIDGKEKDLYFVFTNEQATANNADKSLKKDQQGSENKGFLIISANENVEPVLAYSIDGKIHQNPEDRSPEFNYWMQEYEAQIKAVWENNLKASPEIQQKWENLEKGILTSEIQKSAAVDPLVTTRWDQGNPYNAACPSSFFGGTAVTGCVATAMAQIMKYHNHPPQGEGYHSYNSSQYGTLSADFGSTSYGWGSMSNQPSSSSPSIATLMYHCGVSVNMNYSPQSSGAYVIESDAQNCSEKAMKEYFGYDASTVDGVRRQSYSNTQWTNLIRSELEGNRPVLYAGFGNGGGHAFVCDGVDNSDLFHFNWGWGGYEDGYFQLNALNPNLGGTGAGNGGYNSGQQALIGIQPAYGGNNGGGGNPTPPDPNDDSFYGLALFSQLDIVEDLPLSFNQPFELVAEVGNYGNAPVSGTFAALMYDQAGNQIATINPQERTIQNGFYDVFNFTTGGLTAIPATYTLGVYFKTANTDWRLIGAGDFFNPGELEIVGVENDIRVYSEIEVDPNPIEQGQAFEVNVDIANFANNGTFSGNISVDLYTLEGDYISELDIINTNLNAQSFNSYTFQSAGLTSIEAGTYLLVVWNQPNGGDWRIVGSTDFKNPVYINFAEPGLQADVYENNNSSSEAFTIVPNFNGNNGSFQTVNANIHIGEDQDYFVVDLPAGNSYTVSAEVKDSYNSGNTYTNDMLFARKINNGDWSDTYDSGMPNLEMPNGGKVYFAVASYFVGQVGTYQFIVEVNGQPYTSNTSIELNEITIAPNPSNGIVNITDLPETTSQVSILNIEGKLVNTYSVNNTNSTFTFSLNNIASGIYFVQIEDQKGAILDRKKLVYQP